MIVMPLAVDMAFFDLLCFIIAQIVDVLRTASPSQHLAHVFQSSHASSLRTSFFSFYYYHPLALIFLEPMMNHSKR